jgi:hypothetical protein
MVRAAQGRIDQPHGRGDGKARQIRSRGGEGNRSALARGKTAAGLPKPGAIDFLPFGFEACRPALQTVIDYALQQSLIPRKIDVEELFDATTRALRS